MEQVMELDIILPLEQLKLITDFMLNLPLKMEEIQILCGQQYVGKQWGLFETNAVKNTMQRGTITYAISFSSFGIPFGMLSGYNGIDTRSVLTLENKTKNNFVWVVYTNSAETIMPNNGYFAIGV